MNRSGIPVKSPACPSGEKKPLPRKRGRGWGEGIFLAAIALVAAHAHADALTASALHQAWFAPRAAEFTRVSGGLAPAVQALCDARPEAAAAALERARGQWRASLAAWERLSAVAVGPLLERRSQRQIDFIPTRPRMIEKAVKAAPATARDMELIGTPAKGFPALEWLLWSKPVAPASAECRYAVQVAAEIAREAADLAGAESATQDAQTALSELVNQWVGGLERLRWANLEMPQRVALTAGPPGTVAPDFPRKAAGAGAASWAAQWDAVKSLAAGPVSLAAALRERGKDAVADKLAQAVARSDAALAGLGLDDSERILAAAKVLADLKRLVETEVAPALGVNIGFSDADGD